MNNVQVSYESFDIVVQSRTDGLYNLQRHPHTAPKNGLTHREVRGYVDANPNHSVLWLHPTSSVN